MDNTSTEYKQMHNKIISWNANWIFIFIHFVGRLLLEPSASSTSSFIIYYPNAKMDKSFFKSWVLHIPHHLRDILWMVRSWSSVALIFSSLIMSRASSSWSLLKVIISFWHIPRMNESHDTGRPFKVAITISILCTSSSTSSSWSLIWEKLVRFDCMVSAF